MPQRSNPDDILKQIAKLSTGRHKIFLGMAPGVGKTYRMLEEARSLKKSGIDIVIGYIENQNRADNLKLYEEFEAVPMKEHIVNENIFQELDLEKIIERNPACVVIDELAHTNIKGSLNSKRYDDVNELLKKGISVLSTLNVHQIESIAPLVEKNIGTKVNETIPDWIINNVDELIVVDMPIDDLYKRLETKKIYGEEQIKHAKKNFFKRDNLLMLRDLALNYIAERVDNQVINEKLVTKIKERLLIIAESDTEALEIIQHTKGISISFHANIDVILLNQEKSKENEGEIEKVRKEVQGLKGNLILLEKDLKNSTNAIVNHIKGNRITTVILKAWDKKIKISANKALELLKARTDTNLLVIGSKRKESLKEIETKISLSEKEKKPGELKIYIGMAPGVGKTYKMLQDAHEAYQNGKEVILGVIDTHGRVETAKLMEGLPLLPLKTVKHQDKFLKEFDLEGAILARPDLICVDELAHTNVPGSINNKRYQDVQYLLRAGTNVSTTINIQHIESLNDIIKQFSGIKVRETVPDWIISHANEIVLIDLSPEALQERLKEGKVYSLDKIEQALSHFFQKRNLIALRELSLREVAENVEHEMNPKKKLIKLLTIIDINDNTLKQIRKSARIANRLQAELIIAHILENTNKLSESRKMSIIELEELIVELGGDFRLIEGQDIVGEIIRLNQKIKPFYIVMSETLLDKKLPMMKNINFNKLFNEINDTHIWIT